jgi:hypothetical protein
MKALPADDPSSFKYLASIHGAWYPASFPDHIDAEFCQHDAHTFAFWHRKYLKEVENALQKNGFHGGLPYWDISRDTPGVLPGFFNKSPFDGSRYEGSLIFGPRTDLRSEGQRTMRATQHPKTWHQQIVAGYRACADPNRVPTPSRFLQPTGYLESPHNSVHGYVGGDMGDPTFAAHDPIFFFHHCNVDRNLQLWLNNLSKATRDAVIKQALPEISPLPPWNTITESIARNDGIIYGIKPRGSSGDQPSAAAAAEAPVHVDPHTKEIRITIGSVKKSIHVQSQLDGKVIGDSFIFVNSNANHCANCQKRKIAKGVARTIHHVPKDTHIEKIKVVVVDDPNCQVLGVKSFHYDKEKKPKHK